MPPALKPLNYAAALAYFPKLTTPRYKKLRVRFGSAQMIWEASAAALVEAGLDSALAAELVAWRAGQSVEKITAELTGEQMTTVSLGDAGFPPLLAEIADPPHTLFVRGTLSSPTQPTVAVVGTRACSDYGARVTRELAGALAAQGVCVVSGLALGIDGLAHEAALERAGTTIAVLGSGIDRGSVTPAAHGELAERLIARGGALISEYPPGFKPTGYSFPARNRIIAGLSLGVLVAEAPRESGALITAWAALDYNREVFAVPYPITAENGVGGNTLLQRGAKLVMNVADILDELNLTPASPAEKKPLAPPNQLADGLLAHLSREPVHIDALIKISLLPSATVTSTLTLLELQGLVRNVGGMRYVRS